MTLETTYPLGTKALLMSLKQRLIAPVMNCLVSTALASSVRLATLGPGPIHGHVCFPQPAVLHASPAATRALHAAEAIASYAALWSLAAENAAHPATSAAGLTQDCGRTEAILAAPGLLHAVDFR